MHGVMSCIPACSISSIEMETTIHVHACANCGAVSASTPEPSPASAIDTHRTSTPVITEPANAPPATHIPRAEPDDIQLHIEIKLPFSGHLRRAAVEVRSRVSAADLRIARRIVAAFVVFFLMNFIAFVLRLAGFLLRNVLAKVVRSWIVRIAVFVIIAFWPGGARRLLPFLDL